MPPDRPTKQNNKDAVLFVCTGNICRSPLAEAVFARMLAEKGLEDRFRVDSAGTSDYHLGDRTDPRAAASAARRGYDVSNLRARGLRREDFEDFNIIVAMTAKHLEEMERFFGGRDGLRLFPAADDGSSLDVPDPYYGGESGFETVMDLVERGCANLLAELGKKGEKGVSAAK